MKVLGIDPGTHRVGWAIVSGTPQKQTLIESGLLNSPAKSSPASYLTLIEQELTKVIATHSPTALGIETLLFQKNVKTAISVAEARGVILLVAAKHTLPVYELAPNTIKNAIAGHGGASKSEVMRMVRLLLGKALIGRLDDELDAIATAMTTIITGKFA